MAENYIPRMYNYTLETGTVGTDDEDMASILYDINRMEMKATSDTDDVNDMKVAFAEAFSMALDAAKHLDGFIASRKGKLVPALVEDVQLAFSEAIVIMDDVPAPQTDAEAMSASVKAAYRKMLDVVPSLLTLDDQSL